MAPRCPTPVRKATKIIAPAVKMAAPTAVEAGSEFMGDWPRGVADTITLGPRRYPFGPRGSP